MSSVESPTDEDGKRLEILHEALENADYSCGCGVNEACSYCDFQIDSDDIRVYSTNYDTLEIGVRLSNIDPQSKLARRYNADEDFAETVDLIRQKMDGLRENDKKEVLSEFIEAAELLGRVNRGATPDSMS